MKNIKLSLSSFEPLIQKISDLTKLQRILICVGVVGVVDRSVCMAVIRSRDQRANHS